MENQNIRIDKATIQNWQHRWDTDAGELRTMLTGVLKYLHIDTDVDAHAPYILSALATYQYVTPNRSMGAIQMITNPEALQMSLEEQKKITAELKRYIMDVIATQPLKEDVQHGTKGNNL